MSGLIKGAVPFGLILIIPDNDTPGSNCVETAVIYIVYATSLLVNPLLPRLIKWQLKQRAHLRTLDSLHPSFIDSLLIQDEIKRK